MKNSKIEVKSVAFTLLPLSSLEGAEVEVQGFEAAVGFVVGDTPFFAPSLSGTFRANSSVPVIFDFASVNYLKVVATSVKIDEPDVPDYLRKIAHEIALEIILQNPIDDLSKLPHAGNWFSYKIVEGQLARPEQKIGSFLVRQEAVKSANTVPWIFTPRVEILKTIENFDQGERSFTSLRWCVTEKIEWWRRLIYEFYCRFLRRYFD